MCSLIRETLIINTPNIIKFFCAGKVDIGEIKVKQDNWPAILFIRPNKDSDFLAISWKELYLSWSNSDDILYHAKNDYLVLSKFANVTFKGVIADKTPKRLLSNMSDFLKNKDLFSKSEFMIVVKNITDFSWKSFKMLIQPSHKIDINISNKYFTELLEHPNYSEWISNFNYVEVNLISWTNEESLFKFLISLSSKRVLSLMFKFTFNAEFLTKLLKIIDTYSYLSSLSLHLTNMEQVQILLNYLDWTKDCTLKSHLNLKKDEQTWNWFKKTLKYGKIKVNILKSDEIKRNYKNLLAIRPYFSINSDIYTNDNPIGVLDNMWVSSSLIPYC